MIAIKQRSPVKDPYFSTATVGLSQDTHLVSPLVI